MMFELMGNLLELPLTSPIIPGFKSLVDVCGILRLSA